MTKNFPTVVITGASGYIGSYLVEYFATKNWHVIGLVRDANKKSSTSNIQYVTYDMVQRLDETVFAEADYLIHLSYIKNDRKNPDALKQNTEGTTTLLRAAHKYDLKKTIFMSSMSAQPDAASSYGQQKFRIEKMFNTKRDVNVRSGLVVGNGGLFKQTVDFMRSRHIAPLIGGGNQPIQIIAIYDLARVVEKLLIGKYFGTFTIANARPFTYRSLYKTVARILDIRVLFVPVPFIIPQLVLRLIKLLHLPFPVNEDNLLGL